jgi:hypothetical protein
MVIFALLVGFGIRLWLAASFAGNYDETSYEIVAEIVRRGGNVFAETARYNYTPLWAWILFALSSLADSFALPLHTVVRSFLTLIDLGNAVLIAEISGSIGIGRKSVAFAAYALNPVLIMLVGYHGQFETFALFPLVLAVWLQLRSFKRQSSGLAWALATIAIVIKHIVLFSSWTLVVYTFRRLWTLAIAFAASLVVFALTFVPYLEDGRQGIWTHVFRYRGYPGLYGTSTFVNYQLAEVLFLLGMVGLPLVARGLLRLSLVDAMEFSGVALLVLIPGISEQYFLIPVVFGSVRRCPWYWVYTAIAAVWFLYSPNNVHVLPVALVSFSLLWIAAAAWLLSFFVQWGLQPELDRRLRALLPAEAA